MDSDEREDRVAVMMVCDDLLNDRVEESTPMGHQGNQMAFDDRRIQCRARFQRIRGLSACKCPQPVPEKQRSKLVAQDNQETANRSAYRRIYLLTASIKSSNLAGSSSKRLIAVLMVGMRFTKSLKTLTRYMRPILKLG
jgi:hypothetical protein